MYAQSRSTRFVTSQHFVCSPFEQTRATPTRYCPIVLMAFLATGQAPQVSIQDVSRVEGHAGYTKLRFPIRLSAVSNVPIEVKYATANGSAKSGAGDFKQRSGSVKFLPGESLKVVSVIVYGDRHVEADERFYLNLHTPRGATIADRQAVGTIVNDDAPVPPPVIPDYTTPWDPVDPVE